jgi:hypothetical protein
MKFKDELIGGGWGIIAMGATKTRIISVDSRSTRHRWFTDWLEIQRTRRDSHEKREKKRKLDIKKELIVSYRLYLPTVFKPGN